MTPCGSANLIQSGGMPSNERLQSALWTAIDQQDVPEVRRLLSEGANPRKRTYSLTEQWEVGTLELAWEKTNALELMDALVKGGASVNDLAGRKVFKAAMNIGDLEAVKWFFDNGYDLQGETWPAWTTFEDILRYLVEVQGCEVNARINGRGTPLHFAVMFQREDLVRYLVSQGALVNALDEYRATPIYTAATIGANHIVELMLELGADPTISNYQGNTPLHHVNDCHTALRLIDHGADLSAVNEEGLTPLDMGCPEAIAVIQGQILDKGITSLERISVARRL